MECETQESEAGYNQHLIVLNIGSVSINKLLVTEFITVKVSQNLNLM